ncbi:MAG: sugar ABC transporter permease [Oscillospiraceae bacterium]|nr:sugar ABC transporter permease [Oscillospiraceae bacterium]
MKRLRPFRAVPVRIREAVSGYAFLAPWIAGFLAFTMYPFFYSVFLSIHQVGLDPGHPQSVFVGLKWYREALTVDTKFTIALLETMKFVVLSTPMIVVAALLLALLLNREFIGRAFFRAVFFFPVIIISGPVVSKLLETDAAQVISPESFLIYDFVGTLPGVLSAPLIYIFDNITLILWFSGVQIILFLAGLQKIGKPLREAAAIDGASAWQMLWKIYLPFLRPMILLNTVYTIVVLSNFADNAVNRLITDSKQLTGKAFSYSAAMSWIYLLLIMATLLIAFALLRERKGRG